MKINYIFFHKNRPKSSKHELNDRPFDSRWKTELDSHAEPLVNLVLNEVISKINIALVNLILVDFLAIPPQISLVNKHQDTRYKYGVHKTTMSKQMSSSQFPAGPLAKNVNNSQITLQWMEPTTVITWGKHYKTKTPLASSPHSLSDFAPHSLAYLPYQWLVQSSKQLAPLVILPIIV